MDPLMPSLCILDTNLPQDRQQCLLKASKEARATQLKSRQPTKDSGLRCLQTACDEEDMTGCPPPPATATATATSSGPSAFTVATVQEDDAELAEALASFERKDELNWGTGPLLRPMDASSGLLVDRESSGVFPPAGTGRETVNAALRSMENKFERDFIQLASDLSSYVAMTRNQASFNKVMDDMFRD
ncbi:hypothetical protein D4764_19G0000920 [Takifugu flavidus]|uniref:Uncharacterized protein n=1 Tax=Takifugu flavidus TaxID=433684 RepID=A0A5C6NLH8_9TELE|nr:hypothetical protein D4764_19G0000920 [Takifugu flavidus]